MVAALECERARECAKKCGAHSNSFSPDADRQQARARTFRNCIMMFNKRTRDSLLPSPAAQHAEYHYDKNWKAGSSEVYKHTVDDIDVARQNSAVPLFSHTTANRSISHEFHESSTTGTSEPTRERERERETYLLLHWSQSDKELGLFLGW